MKANRSGAGARRPLIDGVEKVTGAAQYTADLPAPNALVGRIFRSPYAHAEIVSVDTREAAALPGVVAIVTGQDCDKPYGILPISQNEFPLARERIRYRGEPVAAVAAVDAETAERALGLIRLKVVERPAYFAAADARKEDAVLLHDNKRGNLEREVHNEFGDTAAGFARADLVREQTFRCAEVTHAHMEPHAALATYEPERGHLTLHSVTQVPYYVHLSLARCLDMDPSRIRVVKPFIGGGFGARTETLNFEIICGLLARAARGTVRLDLTREETFLTHRGRPESDIRIKIGMTREGRLTACELEMVMRGGAYGGYGIVTILYAGALLNGLYDLPAVKYDGYRVYTNTPPCGAMRGHGTVNSRFAFDTLMGEMATELGLDPIEVRRRNLLKAPTETINGLRVTSYGLPEALDWVERASGGRERYGKLPKGRGLGMACSHFVSGSAKPVHWSGEPHATVILKVTLTTPTLNASNAAVPTLGSTATLKINEWMATAAHGEDWFELYNPDPLPVSLSGLWLSDLPDSPKITQVPALSYIAGGGYADFEADGSNNGNNRCNFKLSAGGDRLILSNSTGATTIDAVQFGSQVQQRSQGRLPDGATTILSFPGTDSRAASNWIRSAIVINEVLSNGNTPGDDFIELHNPTGSAVNIGNWWISDDSFSRRKYQIPAGTSIPAGGFHVIMDGTYDAGVNGFSFDSTGDHAVLTAVDGSGNETGLRDEHEFGAAVGGVAFGRVPVSGGVEFWPQVSVTKGAANSAAKTVPVIINEIHYHPVDLISGDNTRDEFVELHNPATQPVDLSGWHLEGGSDFTFPAGAVLRPGDYVLVLGFDPAVPANASTLDDFRTQFSLSNAVPLFGPFAPKLANDEATVKLSWRGTVNGTIPADFMVDQVKYTDSAPWPTGPDGSGASLQRVARTVIGNDAANWASATPTPGAVNAGQLPIADNDGDGLPNAWETTYGLDPFSSADASAATSANGGVPNLLVYALNGTPGTNAQPKLPAGSVQTLGGSPYLTLSFTHRTGSAALQFQVETTGGNGSWTPAVLVSDTPNGDGTATSLWRSATAFSAGVREFIRLRVVAQ